MNIWNTVKLNSIPQYQKEWEWIEKTTSLSKMIKLRASLLVTIELLQHGLSFEEIEKNKNYVSQWIQELRVLIWSISTRIKQIEFSS